MKQEFVEFYGTQLLVINNGGEPMVSLRHLCSGIGVDLKRQLEKVQSNPSYMCRHMPSLDTSGREQIMVAIPLSQVNGFLFSINANKVKPEIREQLVKYQQECFEVLFRHFQQKEASPDLQGLVSLMADAFEQKFEYKFAQIDATCRGLRDDVDELQMALSCLVDEKEHDIVRKELKKTKEFLKIDGRTLAGKIRGMLGISTYKAPMAGKRIINCCKNLRGEGIRVVEDENRDCQ